MNPKRPTIRTPLDEYRPVILLAVRNWRRRLPARVDWDDLESAAWLGLLRAVRSYRRRHGCTLMTWIWLRVRGAVADAVRQQARRHRRSSPVDVDELRSQLRAPEPGPGLLDVEHLRAVLGPRDYSLLVLRFVEGRTQEWVARRVGCSPSRISQRESVLLGRLREWARNRE